MPPHPRVPIVATIQQAIGSLLTTYEPEFLRIGYSLFMAFATIVLAWHGIKMMLARDGLGDEMFEFDQLMVFVSFGYAFIRFYEAPLPGIGVSFSNLITDQARALPNVLEARSFELSWGHLNDLCSQFLPPDSRSNLANRQYRC